MEQTITLQVNGEGRTFQAQTDSTLLEVLRDLYGLHSVRETCGIGICGACTVLLDDLPISSCLVLAPMANGCRVTTLEGVGAGGRLHPVQQAFIDRMGFQCGYCTPGMVLSAIALLQEQADPAPSAIAEYLAGNLCRCGCYPRIIEAVRLAAERLARRA